MNKRMTCAAVVALVAGTAQADIINVPGDQPTIQADAADGEFVDISGTGIECPLCPWDLDGSGDVGINDFLDLLASWGDPYGITDFLALLAAWGPCP